jgi:GPH family glycoside/pentoside/hexuronide:cation symporter
MAIVVPTVEPLSEKFGKKNIVALGMLFAAIINLAMYLLQIKDVYIYLFLTFLSETGLSYFLYTIWAFVTDAIDFQEYVTGKREEGTVFSIYSAMRKFGQAIAGGLGGYAIHIIGYVPKASEQAPQVAQKLFDIFTLVSAGTFFTVFLVMMFLYPLTKVKLEQLAKDLVEKRASYEV